MLKYGLNLKMETKTFLYETEILNSALILSFYYIRTTHWKGTKKAMKNKWENRLVDMFYVKPNSNYVDFVSPPQIKRGKKLSGVCNGFGFTIKKN